MPETQPYIVIGWFLRSASDPKERILQFEREEQLFHILRQGEGDVRGWRRFISLKSLQGFGLYKVRPLLMIAWLLTFEVRYCSWCPYPASPHSFAKSSPLAILFGT